MFFLTTTRRVKGHNNTLVKKTRDISWKIQPHSWKIFQLVPSQNAFECEYLMRG